MSKYKPLYICEECWEEQEEPGWCQHCQITKNEYFPVMKADRAGQAYGISLYDDIRDESDMQSEVDGNVSATDAEIKSYKDWCEKYTGNTLDAALETLPLKPYESYIPLKPYESYIGSGSGIGANSFQNMGLSTYTGSNGKYSTVKEFPRPAREWRPNAIWFIGDVHSNIDELNAALKEIHDADPDAMTIQVGDLELGHGAETPNFGDNDYFIQGNHDVIDVCEKDPHFLGKFGYKHGIFYIGGAGTKGIGFKNEELTDREFEEAIALYEQVKPEIVVSHDCPQSIFYGKESTRTREALEKMWQIHNPHVWAYGHHHYGRTELYDGCQFIQLAPLESTKIQLGWQIGDQQYKTPSKPMQQTKGKAIANFIGDLFKRKQP